MSLKINNRLCETCIFTDRSPLTPERFVDYQQEWETRGVHQECHAATVRQLHIGCRGHYEAVRRGEAENYPAITTARALFGLPDDVRPEQILGFLEGMHLVEFVEVEGGKEIAAKAIDSDD